MRTEAQVNEDYTKLCVEAGQTQFLLERLNQKLDFINSQLTRLVNEQAEITQPKPEHLDNHFQENQFPDKAP